MHFPKRLVGSMLFGLSGLMALFIIIIVIIILLTWYYVNLNTGLNTL